MQRLAALAWRMTYLRYIAASALSLGVDLALFLSLHAGGVPAASASAAGYCAGIVMHWFASSRAVFASDVAGGIERRRQQALFVASALLGLAITVLVVGAGTWAGIDPRLAKLVAIAISFQATYMMRAKVVFA